MVYLHIYQVVHELFGFLRYVVECDRGVRCQRCLALHDSGMTRIIRPLKKFVQSSPAIMSILTALENSSRGLFAVITFGFFCVDDHSGSRDAVVPREA